MKFQSGQPVADAKVEVTLQEKGSTPEKQNLVTDARGMVTFTIAPLKSSSTFSLTAKV